MTMMIDDDVTYADLCLWSLCSWSVTVWWPLRVYKCSSVKSCKGQERPNHRESSLNVHEYGYVQLTPLSTCVWSASPTVLTLDSRCE